MRDWISTCNSEHENCSPPAGKNGSRLPSRVIDVGTENEEPHLHISNGESVPYATLSHCWGGVSTLTTTADTLEARKQEIPLSAFPKTYKDAVLITRGLGIKYLWIDSLCIVQDDKLDWFTESLQMANVYSNAEILIAASDAADSSEGCLKSREAPWKIEYTSPESTTSGDGPKPFLLAYPCPSFLFSILKARLNTRAWCLQEVALSRRTLHCTNSRLYWQCGQTVWSEDGLDPYNGLHNSEFGADMRFNLPTHTRQTWRKPWVVAVMDYSSRQLTFQSDKMAAISGITNFFKEKLNDVPVFGLWRDCLHYGLLWRCSSAEMRRPKELSGLPSWSWASLEGPIHTPITDGGTKKTTNKAEVIHVDIFKGSEGLTTTPLARPRLVVAGRMISALCLGTSQKGLIDATGPAPEYAPLVSLRGDPSYAVANGPVDETDESTLKPHIGWCTFDLLPYGVQRTVACLEISTTDWRIDNDDDWPLTKEKNLRTNYIRQTHNIIVLEKYSEAVDEYRRIGVGLIDQAFGEFDGRGETTMTIF